jgi:predicted permease
MNWRRFLRRERADAEQREELENYLEITTHEYMERGMGPEQARIEARRKLGNATLIREEVYLMNTIPLFDDLWRDARHALRMIRKQPGFSVMAILSLALGIGANTSIFSVVHAILVRPLPYPASEALIGIANRFVLQGQVFDDAQLSAGMFAFCRDNAQAFERFGVWVGGAATVSGNGVDPEQVVTVTATQQVLPALGIPPLLGRWFSDEDDRAGSEPTVVLTHGYWQRRFGGDPRIIGQTATIDFQPRRIIGVMPPDFRFLDLKPDLFLPQQFEATNLKTDSFSYNGLARLKPGVTLGMANQDLARVWNAMAEAQGLTRMFAQLQVTPNARPLKRDVIGDVGGVLSVLMGALGLVLLLVCANVANLVLVRAHARKQEFAIRAALGAGWGRIARELLVECLVLGLLGGAAGLGLAAIGLQSLVAYGPSTLPRLSEISIDSTALLFTLACSLGASLFFGLAAVWKSRSPAKMHNARGATQSANHLRAQNTLVVAQVALAFVLLAASGLMIRTFLAIQAVQPGFTQQPEQVQMVRLSIPQNLVENPDRVIAMQHEILKSLAAIPDVTATGFANGLPLEKEYRNGMLIGVEGKVFPGNMPPNRVIRNISPGLLAAQGTRLVAGREFQWEDVYGKRRLALVSESMARDTWGAPASSAVGKRIQVGRNGPLAEVIGVVEDVRLDGVHLPAPETVYFRVGVEPSFTPGGADTVRRGMTFAIRSRRAGTESFLREVGTAVHHVHPDLPLAKVRTLGDLYRTSMARTSFALVLLGISGGMALVLAVVGVYGILAYAVAQRRREVSIRLALGAEPAMLRWLFLRKGLLLNALGGTVGLAAAVALSRWVSSLLFGVAPLDPLTFLVTGAVLAAASAVASFVPARRAASVDPVESLRNE